MPEARSADDSPLPLGQSDAALDSLMGALAEFDLLATVADPARPVAAAQLSSGQNDEIMKDLRAYLASVRAFLAALEAALP